MTSFNSFLKINDVRTHVACWGRWVEENEPDEVIIVIPGNPGLAGFYYSYMEELHKNTNLPVWILGHAGHEEPHWSSGFAPIQPIKGNEQLFNLEGQYNHKAEFIKRYTKPSTKVHLIGHSIGGWISMELLRHEELKDRLVSIPPKQVLIDTVYKYLQRSVVEKVLFLAFDEMDEVLFINLDIFLHEKSRIKIVYGEKDAWSPAHYFEEYKRQIPDYYIRKVPYRHAFCLNAYSEMASISADLISSH